MNHDDLLSSLRQSAAVKLLQSQNAPLVLSYLYDQFKQKQRSAIPHTEMLESLTDYLEALKESHPGRYSGTAVYYLRLWCDDDHRFLRRYYEADSDDPVYDLVPETERGIAWVEELQKSDFVGTESRFLRIFDLLQEIVTYGTEDITTRLAQLEREKAQLQAQIDSIKATGEVEQYSQTQIKERFFEANDVARRLLSDFREVEENFRAIARQVQEQQLVVEARKGQILRHVLDADVALKESDQGRSFYAFWEFLISAQRQEALQALLTAVYRLPDLQQIDTVQSQRLRRLKRNLIDAAAKIVGSNRRLGEQLRKLLDEQNLAEARRVMELATEIKQTAVQLAAHPPEQKEFLWIEADPAIDMPVERPLWSVPTTTNYANIEPGTETVALSLSHLEALFSQFYVDESRLRRRIVALLDKNGRVTLGEVTAVHPITQGLAELVTYVALAAHNEAHQIDGDGWEEITLGEDGRVVRLPRIVYRKPPRSE
ncbi:MAG: DUF3375 domain-containing protein [Chloroflexi bacterium]|nr:DUF3375 domain-containing protein [Chloroflexota bacterium]